MSPLDATVQLLNTWAVTGLLKGRTPDELRGDAIALCVGLQGAVAPPKRERKRVLPSTHNSNSAEPARGPVHFDPATMPDPRVAAQAPPKEADPWQ